MASTRFDVGTVGAHNDALSAANTGSSSVVSTGGSGVLSNAESNPAGSLAAVMTASSTSGGHYFQKSSMSSTALNGDLLFKIKTNPSGAVTFVWGGAGSQMWQIDRSSTGTLLFKDDGGVLRWTSGTTLSSGVWYWLRWYVVNSATVGQFRVQLSTAADPSTMLDDSTLLGNYDTGGAAYTDMRMGPKCSTGTVTGVIAVGSWSYDPAATGVPAPYSTTKSGAGEGSIGWAGTATGATVHAAAASGAVGWAGSATGVAPSLAPNAGAGEGSIGWAGSSTGARQSAASGVGSIGWDGAATGATVHSAAASGTVGWGGAATGATTRHGAAAGAVAWAGTATGEAPTVGGAEGSGAGGIGWAGSAIGTRPSTGTGAGGIGWAGAATGTRPSKGAGDGAVAWTGSATGTKTPAGIGAGSIQWTGDGTGAARHYATAAGLISWAGTATGTATGGRDITVAVTISPPRWLGAVGARTKTATIGARRWAGRITP